MDYLLRTNIESDMDAALEAAGLLVEQDMGDGEIALQPIHGVYLDRIGPIPAVVDEEGIIVKPGHPEFHANLRVTIELTKDQVDELPLFAPLPSVPYRVFC